MSSDVRLEVFLFYCSPVFLGLEGSVSSGLQVCLALGPVRPGRPLSESPFRSVHRLGSVFYAGVLNGLTNMPFPKSPSAATPSLSSLVETPHRYLLS